MSGVRQAIGSTMCVNTADQLKKRLEELGVKWVIDEGKGKLTALYLDVIEDTRRFLHCETIESGNKEFLPDHLGLTDEQIRKIPALREKKLLADLFGNKVPRAVFWQRDDWPNADEILPDGDEWQERTRQFVNTPSGRILLETVRVRAGNALKNIAECCKRVLSDWAAIERVFFKGNTLNQLTEIKLTDSDSHKGGKQVLILTFDSSRKVVYKPSDVEADCLIVSNANTARKSGDTELQALFEGKRESLMDLLNSCIKDVQSRWNSTTAKHAKALLPFPVYKILPRNRGSGLQNEKIRDSYGYLEFLSYDVKDYDLSAIPKNRREKVRQAFWGTFGQIAAIALAFSFSDLHDENFIAHSMIPHLIDLETSFVAQIDNLAATAIYLAMSKKNEKEKNQLRLGEMQSLADDDNWITAFRAFASTMRVLQDKEIRRETAAWCRKLDGVIVRVVPVVTGDWITLLSDAFLEIRKNSSGHENKSLELTVREVHPAWTEGLAELGEDAYTVSPRKVVMWDHVSDDLRNLDIPVFYHRLREGNQSLMNSSGKEIKIAHNSYNYFSNPPLSQLVAKQTVERPIEAALLDFVEETITNKTNEKNRSDKQTEDLKAARALIDKI